MFEPENELPFEEKLEVLYQRHLGSFIEVVKEKETLVGYEFKVLLHWATTSFRVTYSQLAQALGLPEETIREWNTQGTNGYLMAAARSAILDLLQAQLNLKVAAAMPRIGDDDLAELFDKVAHELAGNQLSQAAA